MALRIDPHAHTIKSDGTDTPTGLIQAAKKAGLDVVGITDHDTMAGWDEAAEAASAHGIGLLRGVEVSSVYQGHSVHVLGYLMDPLDPGLNTLFLEAQSSRSTRLREMADNLAQDYPLISWESILARAQGGALGRPHLADELIERGYFANRAEAFAFVLSPQSPYFVPQRMPTPAEAVALIRAGGGVPVLAHPQSAPRGWTVPEEVVAQMVQGGLFGIERDHRDHEAVGRIEVDRVAKRFGLATTGGSDYHGSGKPNALGENLLGQYILAQIEEQGTSEVIRR